MSAVNKPVMHHKIRLLALIVLAGSLPFRLVLLSNLSIFLLGFNWLLESTLVTKWERLKMNPVVFLFISFYVIYLVGLLYSQNFKQGAFELEKKLSLIVFPLILASSNAINRGDLRRIFKSFVFFTTIAGLVCIGYAIYLNYKEGHTLSYVYNAIFHDVHLQGKYYYFNFWYFTYELFAKPIHMHPVYFAMYLVFSSCLSVWLWWDRALENKKIFLGLVFLLLFNFVVVVLLSSRTQLFILMFFGTCFILYQTYLKKKLLLGLTAVLLLGGLSLILILLNPVSRERFLGSMRPGAHFSENKYGEGGLSLRKYKWKYALETIRNTPLQGTGTGDAQDELQKTYIKHDFAIGYENRFNAHNQFLQSALEVGIAALVSFTLCLLIPFYRAMKRNHLLYAVFIVLFTISCFTESMLEANKGIVFFSFFSSLFAFHDKPEKNKNNVRPKGSIRF